MRTFPYYTVGWILKELIEDSKKYLSPDENPIHISRPTFYKLEEDGIIPNFRKKSIVDNILRPNKESPWRTYNRSQVNEIKIAIWNHYKKEDLAKKYKAKLNEQS